jgi:hypothetical protein
MFQGRRWGWRASRLAANSRTTTDALLHQKEGDNDSFFSEKKNARLLATYMGL